MSRIFKSVIFSVPHLHTIQPCKLAETLRRFLFKNAG